MKKNNRVKGALFMVGPLFPEILIRNGGLFPSSTDEEIVNSYAAWYVARCCNMAILDLPEQVSMEGDTDVTVRLAAIRDGCLRAYGLDHESGDVLNAVMNLMPLCRRQAFMRQVKWTDRFQAWLDSGGRAYNEVTREPDKG